MLNRQSLYNDEEENLSENSEQWLPMEKKGMWSERKPGGF